MRRFFGSGIVIMFFSSSANRSISFYKNLDNGGSPILTSFELSDPISKLLIGHDHFSHMNEGSHDEYAHLHSSGTAKNSRKHRDSLLSEADGGRRRPIFADGLEVTICDLQCSRSALESLNAKSSGNPSNNLRLAGGGTF